MTELLEAWKSSDLHRVSFRNFLYDTIAGGSSDTFRSATLLEDWSGLDESLFRVFVPGASEE